MSRRRGEFEHRTSLFEGAYRAWSHLGNLDPADVFSKSVTELDPLNMKSNACAASTTQTTAAAALAAATKEMDDDDDSKDEYSDDSEIKNVSNEEAPTTKNDWRYEPLPRSGLEHPFVRSILNPWLGKDAEVPAEVEQGLATLRNWWQHRRKGERRSALNALGTEKMRGVVDGYTRHFFRLALELVRRDKAHPPKSLLQKMGGPKSERNRRFKPAKLGMKEHNEDETEVSAIMTAMAGTRGTDSLRSSFTTPSLAGPLGLGLGGLGTGTLSGGADELARERNLALLAGLGGGANALSGLDISTSSSSTIELLLAQQQQRQNVAGSAGLEALELAQLARQRQFLAATSVLSPLEQLHLLQRQRQLALLGAGYPSPLSSLAPASAVGISHYSPPSWLLEPVTREQAVEVDEKPSRSA
jgi:hypothetical protein